MILLLVFKLDHLKDVEETLVSSLRYVDVKETLVASLRSADVEETLFPSLRDTHNRPPQVIQTGVHCQQFSLWNALRSSFVHSLSHSLCKFSVFVLFVVFDITSGTTPLLFVFDTQFHDC